MGGNKESLVRKIWSVIMPLVVYYAVFVTAFFLLSYCLQMLTGITTDGTASRAGHLFEENRENLTGIVNGLSMLIGAAVLLPMLREEIEGRQTGPGQNPKRTKKTVVSGREEKAGRYGVIMVLLTVALAAVSSIGLNILLSLTGLVKNSAGYQEVARTQYGVAFGVGLLLYIVVSPLAEEVVFRGVIYNRLRRYFWGAGYDAQDRQGEKSRQAAAILLSSLLFGIYHGNPVQGVYGCCMGILMAYMYERTQAFGIPVLFHATANCVVYLTAHNMVLQEKIFTVPCCVVLLGSAAALVLLAERILAAEKSQIEKDKEKKSKRRAK